MDFTSNICLAFLTLIIIFIISFAVFVSKLDTDITFWFYEKFGKSITTLNNKVIWITGASSGIGEELAYALANVSAKLVLSGRDEDSLARIKRKCLSLNKSLKGNDIFIVPFDITKLDVHESNFKKILEHFSKIDILVNNAGRYMKQEFQKSTTQADMDLFMVNLFGTINLTKLVVNHWYDNQLSGHIVVNSSGAGIVPVPLKSVYCATKYALHGYFNSLRLEAYHRNIRVSIICPGFVETPLFSKVFSGQPNEIHQTGKHYPSVSLSSKRCANIIAVAIANEISESWTAAQPSLFLTYVGFYLSDLYRISGPKSIDKKALDHHWEHGL